jgi:hypothetical protein
MSLYIHATNDTDGILSQLQNATQQCSNTTVGDVSYNMFCTSIQDATQGHCVNLPTNYTTHGINCTNDVIGKLADQYGNETEQNCFISCTNLTPSSTSLSNTITPDFLLMVIVFFSVFLMFGRKD